MKIFQNKWNSFFIACLIWLVTVVVVVIVALLSHPLRSNYEGGFYNCVQLNVDILYECSYFDYVLNVVFTQTLGWIRGLFVMPGILFLLLMFYPESTAELSRQSVFLILGMPYVFIPVAYGLLRWFSRYLISSRSPSARG